MQKQINPKMSSLSIAQTYMLASKAQAKLQREAQRPELNLRVLLSHAHLLDNVVEYLSNPASRSCHNNNTNGYPKLASTSPDVSDEEIDNEEDFEIEIEDAEFLTEYFSQEDVSSGGSSSDEDLDYDDIEIIRTDSHSNDSDIKYVNYFKPNTNSSMVAEEERNYITNNNVMFSVSELSDSDDSDDYEDFSLNDPYRYRYYEDSFIDCKKNHNNATNNFNPENKTTTTTTTNKKKSTESFNSSSEEGSDNSDFSYDELDELDADDEEEEDYVLSSTKYHHIHSGSYYFEDPKTQNKLAQQEEETDITEMENCHIPRRSVVF